MTESPPQNDSAPSGGDDHPSLPRRLLRRVGPRIRLAFYLVAGVLTPVVCFGAAAPEGSWAADEPWQAGQFWVYATLLLKWPAAAPFYPLLLYSMGSLALFAWNRDRFGRSFAVRLGLFGGVLLALQYCWLVYAPSGLGPTELGEVVGIVVVTLTAVAAATVIAILLAWLMWNAYRALNADLGARRVVAGAVVLAVLACTGAILLAEDPAEFFLGVVAFPLVVTVVFGPAWSAIAYSIASMEAVRTSAVRWRWNLKHVLGLTAWLACLFGAWRRAMTMAIAEYTTLPTSDPNCFVCSAAARGHSRLVRSEAVALADGRVVRVNDQLRRLKAAELALRIVAPRVHRATRRVYDRFGPPLARRLGRPWLADAAYFALKPAEWTARVVLGVAFGAGSGQISRLYRGDAAEGRRTGG
jgi:hypothetical protein